MIDQGHLQCAVASASKAPTSAPQVGHCAQPACQRNMLLSQKRALDTDIP